MSLMELAVVDDADVQAIQYSFDGWISTQDDDSFGNTLRIARDSASAAFTFTGTSVTVYGLRVSIQNTSVTFKVDDGNDEVEIVTADRDETGFDILYQAPIFRSGTLQSGRHTLTMSRNANVADAEAPWYLDFIAYTPTPDTPRNGLQLFIDDRDSRIQYGPGWVQEDSIQFFTMQTSTHSNVSESSFQFDFDGIGISIFGQIARVSPMPRAEIVVDGSSPVVFSPSPPASTLAISRQIFSVDNLGQGSHRMVVTLKNNGLFSLDSIVVRPGAASSTSSTDASSSSTSSTSSDSASSSNTETNGSVLAGAIAGGVVGGIAVLTAIFLVIYWRYRRRKSSNTPVPYEPPELSLQSEPFHPPVSVLAMPRSRENISIVHDSRPTTSDWETLSGIRSSSASSGLKAQVYLRPPEDAVVRLEDGLRDQDSGWRSSSAGDAPRLPPSYTAS